MQMNCKVQRKKAIKIYDQKFYIVLPCLFANPYIGMVVLDDLGFHVAPVDLFIKKGPNI